MHPASVTKTEDGKRKGLPSFVLVISKKCHFLSRSIHIGIIGIGLQHVFTLEACVYNCSYGVDSRSKAVTSEKEEH